MGKIRYYMGGEDISTRYGVKVSASYGILDRPKLKKRDAGDWDDYHGELVDTEKRYYEPREIVLDCFVKAPSHIGFIVRVQQFFEALEKAGTFRLMIELDEAPSLQYEVYCKDSIDINKRWNNQSMVGTFRLKLVEPEPLKRVLRHTVDDTEASKLCDLAIGTSKLVNIFWGDGTADYDIYGDNITIKHIYASSGTYYPIITGCIDEIENFTIQSTEATELVWQRFL